MENITKALFIAAGFLLAVIIASLLIVGYNQISAYYQERSNSTDIEQIVEITKKFINYDGRTIRGNEMLSVINMVVDYNNWVNENSEKGYEEIELNISFASVGSYKNSNNKYDSFHIVDNIEYLIPTILQNNCITNKPSNKLKLVSERINKLLEDLNQISLITNNSVKTEKTLQLLSSNVHNINVWLTKEDGNGKNTDEENTKIASLLDSILKTSLNSEDITIVKNNLRNNKNNIKKLREVAAKYYEITQFKRAYFTCKSDNGNIGVELYNNGRVKKLNFVIETNNNGDIKFN